MTKSETGWAEPGVMFVFAVAGLLLLFWVLYVWAAVEGLI